MKKFTLLISSFLLAISQASVAQELVFKSSDAECGIVPGKFTYSQSPLIIVLSEPESAEGAQPNGKLTIMDSQTNVVKTLDIPFENRCSTTHTERAVVKPTGAEKANSYENASGEISEDVTIRSSIDFANYMNNYSYLQTRSDAFVPYFVPGENGVIACCRSNESYFYLPTFLGLTYPTEYFVLRGNSIFKINVSYKPLYDEADAVWTNMGDEQDWGGNFKPLSFEFASFGTGTEGNYLDVDICATQTLFNDDEAWEYLVPVQEENSTIDYISVEEVTTEGVVLYRSVSKGMKTTAINVVSENGTVLASIPFSGELSKDYLQVLLLEGTIFFQLGFYGNNSSEYYDYLYRYDKQGGDLDKVAAVRRSNRFATLDGDRLDVNLEDADANGNLLLTNSLGKVLHSEKVQRGKGSASINTSSLPEGIYNVTLMQRGKVRKNHKMLIK